MRDCRRADQLRILVITERYPPYHVGGYEIACQRTCDLLAQRGHEVHVLTSTWGVEGCPDELGVSRVLFRLPPEGTAVATPKYFLKQVIRAWHLRRNATMALGLARHFSPDIVFVWQSEGIGIGTAVALQRAGYPVIHRRDDEAMADLLDRLQRDRSVIWRKCRQLLYGVTPRELRSADLIVVSSFLHERHATAGFDPERIVTIWNGVPKSVIICKKIGHRIGNSIRLLFAGRVCHEKGVHIAIQALALVRDKSHLCFEIDLVGPAEETYLKDLKHLVHSLDLDDTVEFLGPRDSSNMVTLYDRYDALVFPSIVREGFGLTLIEAMARGLPAIAVDRGGPRDIITSGIDGMLVKPEDPEALASALVDLFTNDLLLHSIQANAPGAVHRKFTLEGSVERIEEMLFECCSNNLYGHSRNRLYLQQKALAARRVAKLN